MKKYFSVVFSALHKKSVLQGWNIIYFLTNYIAKSKIIFLQTFCKKNMLFKLNFLFNTSSPFSNSHTVYCYWIFSVLKNFLKKQCGVYVYNCFSLIFIDILLWKIILVHNNCVFLKSSAYFWLTIFFISLLLVSRLFFHSLTGHENKKIKYRLLYLN